MRLLLLCSAILSACWGAAIPTPTTETVPSFLNSSIPRFVAKTVERTSNTDKYSRILMYKNGKLTNLLESGTCIASAAPSSTITYFGSSDGIYRYDDSTGKVERYGTLHDSIVGILEENRTDDLYILTEDHAVYKVTDGGTKKVEIPEAKGAEQFELDWDDNLYYYGEDYQPYVVTSDGVKKIEGLPAFSNTVHFLKSWIRPTGIALVSRNGPFALYPDGTSEPVVVTDEMRAQSEAVAREAFAFMDILKRLEEENNL